MTDTSALKKKLASYSAVASALLLCQKASSQIVYTDIIPDHEICDLWCDDNQFILDLNNDGIFDFRIKDFFEHTTNGSTLWGATSSTTNSVKASAYNNNQVKVDTTNLFPLQLNSGDALNSVGEWVDHGRLYFRQEHNGQIVNSEGLWFPDTIAYLGLRLELNGQNHYGWVRLHLDHIPWSNHMNVYVFDYAYNAFPDSAIVIGESYSTNLQSEPLFLSGANDIKVFCSDKIIRLMVENQWLKSSIKIYSIEGKPVKEQKFLSSENIIDMRQFASGIYFIQVRQEMNNGKLWVKKIYIE